MSLARNNGKFVIMLPDVQMETMSLVLKWSAEGYVDLIGQNMVDEVMLLLHSLDVCPELSVELKTVNVSISQEERLKEPGNNIMAVNPQCEVSGENNGDMVSMDSSMNNYSNRSKVPLMLETSSHNLVKDEPHDDMGKQFESGNGHCQAMSNKLSDSINIPAHVHSLTAGINVNEVDLTAEDDDDSDKELNNFSQVGSQVDKTNWIEFIRCQLCDEMHQTYYQYAQHLSLSHYEKQLTDLFDPNASECPICKERMNGTKRDKLIHLGFAHKQVLLVACQSVKAQLEDLLAFGQCHKPKTFSWKKCKMEILKLKNKWPCCKDFICSPQDLRFHLSTSHYEDELIDAHGPIGKLCKLCHAEKQYAKHCKRDIILHMLSSHPCVLYDLMDKQAAFWLQDCFKNDYNCPVCKKNFGTLGLIKRHLCRSHFKVKILEKANGKLECDMCQTLARRRQRQGELTYHLGVQHNLLEMVLPDYVKSALKKKEHHQEKNIKKNSLRKFCRQKKGQGIRSYACPMCSHRLNDMPSLRSHVAVKHYQKEILKQANLMDFKSNQCPQCHKELAVSKSMQNIRWQMARHLGTKHGYLDRVIPDKLKKTLDELSRKYL